MAGMRAGTAGSGGRGAAVTAGRRRFREEAPAPLRLQGFCFRGVAPAALVSLPTGILSGGHAHKIYGGVMAREHPGLPPPFRNPDGRRAAPRSGRWTPWGNTPSPAEREGCGKRLAASALVPEHHVARPPAVAGKEG